MRFPCFSGVLFRFGGGVLVLTLTGSLVVGCASRKEQLENVAKDWCETIRASQVIPVYPPTADLLPGDMYLVDRPIREQHIEWAERGFLALPFEMPRMEMHQLPSLYERYQPERWAMFEDGVDPDPDDDDPKPGDEDDPEDPGEESPEEPDPDDEPEPGDGPSPEDESTPGNLKSRGAPIAAFPSYSFSVSNKGSFDLALPVQGVPIGLAAVGSSGANGTITLKDVRTYGYDNYQLFMKVRDYWSEAGRQAYLAELAAASRGTQPYLRVVSRVYGVRSFNVTLNASQSFGVGMDAGATVGSGENSSAPSNPQASRSAESSAVSGETAGADTEGNPVANQPPNEAAATNATRLEGLNAKLSELDKTAFGVNARFVSASSRSVSLVETFDEPLVVGYLGFDLPITPEGELGSPVPTFDVLSRGVVPTVVYRGTITAWHNRMNTMLKLVEPSRRTENERDALMLDAVGELGKKAEKAYSTARKSKAPLDAFDAAVMKLQRPYKAASAASERVYQDAVESIEKALVMEAARGDG